MPGPLSHLRALDLSRVLAGHWASQNLADLGAEVIKIERPGTGDDTRGWGPPWMKDGAGKDTSESAYFLSVNRNKKSVTLDISRPEGRKIARELADKCHVLIENYKVGALKKYGLHYEKIKETNPSIIYCSITGFGQDGPYAPRPGYDFIFQGMGGLMSITGERDGHIILAIGDDGQFERFCEITGAASLAQEPRFKTMSQRIIHREELIPLIAGIMRTRTKREWIETLEAANVPCGPIDNMKEVLEDPQVRHRRPHMDMPHPLGGVAPMVRSPLRLPETPVEYRIPPPTLGQHNAEILKGLLGRSDADLKRLRDAGIF